MVRRPAVDGVQRSQCGVKLTAEFSDCRTINIIVDRLRSLLIFKCQLCSESVDLLLGPFVDFFNHYKGTVHSLLRRRMEMMWEIYKEHAAEIPRHFTFPYYMGILMDLHVPGIRLGPKATLQELYTRGLAPENVTVCHIENDESSRVDPDILERHWVSYLCHVDRPTKTVRAGKTIRPRKKSNAKNRDNRILKADDVNPVRPSRQDPKSLNEMLTKGQPNQTVVRYVAKAFSKGLLRSPASNPVIITMTRAFFLGAYRHSTVIADPASRIDVYIHKSPADLHDMLQKASFNAKQLYYILAEFIVASTAHDHAVELMLRSNPGHVIYQNNARFHGDDMRSTRYPKLAELVRPPKAVYTHRAPSYIRLFWELVRHLDVKAKPPMKRVLSASEGIGLEQMLETLSKQPNTLQIFKTILEELEVPANDIEIIQTAFSASNDRIFKMMKKMLGQLSQIALDKLYMYVFYVSRRAMLSYVPIGHVDRGRRKDNRMVVCRRCFMIRTPCLMDASYKKSKTKGVQLDIEERCIRCSGCKSDQVDHVNMSQMYVFGPSVSNSLSSQMYCGCTRCGITTVFRHVIGTCEFCPTCYHEELAGLLLVRKCVCGNYIDDKMPHRTINAINSRGQVALYALCKRHLHLQSACRPTDVQPVEFYRKLITLSERKRKREV